MMLKSWVLAAQLLAKVWGWSQNWFPFPNTDVQCSQIQFPKQAFLCLFLFLCASYKPFVYHLSHCPAWLSSFPLRNTSIDSLRSLTLLINQSAEPVLRDVKCCFPSCPPRWGCCCCLWKNPCWDKEHTSWTREPTERDAQWLWGQARDTWTFCKAVKVFF